MRLQPAGYMATCLTRCSDLLATTRHSRSKSKSMAPMLVPVRMNCLRGRMDSAPRMVCQRSLCLRSVVAGSQSRGLDGYRRRWTVGNRERYPPDLQWQHRRPGPDDPHYWAVELPLTVTAVMTDSTLLVAGPKLLSCPNLIAAMCRLLLMAGLGACQVRAA
jgi:hypothetical protein